MTRIAVLILPLVLAFAPRAEADMMSNELLLSSAWCSFTFNKTTGYSHTKRVFFTRDGTYGLDTGGEGSSSGSGGSMASQSRSSGGGMWRVEKGELFMSEGRGQLERVDTVLKRNNNGSYIIVADRLEYSQCR